MNDSNEKDRYFAELLRLAQDGNSQAYEELLKGLQNIVRAFVISRLSDTSSVEDVVQDVLLSIHGARHTFDSTKPFFPWFFAIVRRRYIDSLRRTYRKRDRGLDERLPNSGEYKDAVQEPSFELMEALRREFLRLPEKQQIAFRLTKIEGYSVADTAEKTGMTESAVKVYVHRAYKALKKSMER